MTPASRLVAHVVPSVASGLGLRILAAGPAWGPHYSCRGRLCRQTSSLNSSRRQPLGELAQIGRLCCAVGMLVVDLLRILKDLGVVLVLEPIKDA